MGQEKQEQGAPPQAGSGHSAEPEPEEVSAVPVSVPNAVAKLRENADALQSWIKGFDEHARHVSDPVFGRGYGIEEQVGDLFRITSRLAASIYGGLLEAAIAIEAATAGETPKDGSTEGESAGRRHRQEPSQKDSPDV